MHRTTFFLLLLLILGSCDRQSFEERFVENCPYERRFPPYHHQLVVPVEFVPHQKVYSVGDTMTIRSVFSDSIYDNNFQTYFKVKNFPFRAVQALYKLTEEGFEQGLRLNELIVDDQYEHRYFSRNDRSDESIGGIIYDPEEGHYHYEIKLVFQTPGVYSTIMDEGFNNIPFNFKDDILEQILDQIEFEEYCGESFSPNVVVQGGDPHYDDFLDELIHMDENVFMGQLSDFGGRLSPANSAIEFHGVFLFEVVE